jgi:cytochrome P450
MPDEEPPKLTDDELHLFFSLLFAGGSETTRNATAGGVLALIQHPDQLARLQNDRSLVPLAVEEIVRWTSPASHQRRTATRDVELAGHRIEAGDKVVLWEASANRDDAVFGDGMRFDTGRDPNPHLGFGHGVHFCLGASLAQLEIRVMLDELLERFAGFELTGEPEWTRSNKHTGLRHLPVRMHAR